MADNFYKFSKGVNLTPQGGADPSNPRNGDIYYNSSLGKFRKYENGAWSDISGSSTFDVDSIIVSEAGDVVTASGNVITTI